MRIGAKRFIQPIPTSLILRLGDGGCCNLISSNQLGGIHKQKQIIHNIIDNHKFIFARAKIKYFFFYQTIRNLKHHEKENKFKAAWKRIAETGNRLPSRMVQRTLEDYTELPGPGVPDNGLVKHGLFRVSPSMRYEIN